MRVPTLQKSTDLSFDFLELPFVVVDVVCGTRTVSSLRSVAVVPVASFSVTF